MSMTIDQARTAWERARKTHADGVRALRQPNGEALYAPDVEQDKRRQLEGELRRVRQEIDQAISQAKQEADRLAQPVDEQALFDTLTAERSATRWRTITSRGKM